MSLNNYSELNERTPVRDCWWKPKSKDNWRVWFYYDAEGVNIRLLTEWMSRSEAESVQNALNKVFGADYSPTPARPR